jgi:maltose alpha-D-glucosyltransferase/alpha-amylase
MLGAERERLELAFNLLLTLPGTPVLYYGDEIGMGDDLSLPERHPVRTAMQWAAERNGGFSTATASRLRVPLINKGEFGYRRVNVADQQRDQESFLNWMERGIRSRSECPEFGRGAWDVIGSRDPSVLAMRYTKGEGAVIALHNLAAEGRRMSLGRAVNKPGTLWEVFGNRRYDDEGSTTLELDPYGYRWLRQAPGG